MEGIFVKQHVCIINAQGLPTEMYQALKRGIFLALIQQTLNSEVLYDNAIDNSTVK